MATSMYIMKTFSKYTLIYLKPVQGHYVQFTYNNL